MAGKWQEGGRKAQGEPSLVGLHNAVIKKLAARCQKATPGHNVAGRWRAGGQRCGAGRGGEQLDGQMTLHFLTVRRRR